MALVIKSMSTRCAEDLSPLGQPRRWGKCQN